MQFTSDNLSRVLTVVRADAPPAASGSSTSSTDDAAVDRAEPLPASPGEVRLDHDGSFRSVSAALKSDFRFVPLGDDCAGDQRVRIPMWRPFTARGSR